MRDPRLARRYAAALLEAARDQGATEEVMDAMENVIAPLVADETFLAFWLGPQLPVRRKVELIEEIFAALPPVLRHFLMTLLDKKRESVLLDVPGALRERHDEESGVVRAHLTTALPLEEKQAAPFIAYLKARLGGEVKLTREVDPELIAGFRLSWRDKVIDGSVARSIQEIRRRLSA